MYTWRSSIYDLQWMWNVRSMYSMLRNVFSAVTSEMRLVKWQSNLNSLSQTRERTNNHGLYPQAGKSSQRHHESLILILSVYLRHYAKLSFLFSVWYWHVTAYSTFTMRATWLARLILPDFITLRVYGQEYKLQSSSLCIFLQSTVISWAACVSLWAACVSLWTACVSLWAVCVCLWAVCVCVHFLELLNWLTNSNETH